MPYAAPQLTNSLYIHTSWHWLWSIRTFQLHISAQIGMNTHMLFFLRCASPHCVYIHRENVYFKYVTTQLGFVVCIIRADDMYWPLF